ncbi:TetR/AcrR family transcriptional regulator [Paraburkholderia sp. GAS348]|uniref:TetR/AcrR family transcriptional regulator n=1 Tax=Paraburkholderia sp. GAS348 TaxID=3035132 RepID=UPI003D215196
MREEIKEYKRSRIIEEASRLFYEQGFEATSVEMLASELGVTKPFIYSYFPNKRSILEAVYEQSASRLVGHIQQALKSDGTPEERLSQFIRVFVNENIKHQIAVGIYMQEEKNLSPGLLERVQDIERSFNKLLAQLIQEGVDANVFHVPDAKLASLCISGMVRWVHRWYHPNGRLNSQEIAAKIATLGMNMVGYRQQPPAVDDSVSG